MKKFEKTTEYALEDFENFRKLNLIGSVGHFKLFDNLPFEKYLIRKNQQALDKFISGIENTYMFKMINEDN